MTEPAAIPRAEYPRPQFVRERWQCLNGQWQFAREDRPVWQSPGDVQWCGAITVPFAPETPLSGVGDTGFHHVCWYRRTFAPPMLAAEERLLLHFGAVDYAATVWVNDVLVARHEGGYTPFSADITDALRGTEEQTVIVRAEDDPHDLAKPRGKQDWQREPHRIWYPRTSGIWQSVWLEPVPVTRIVSLAWGANLERYEIEAEATITGPGRDGARLHVTLRVGNVLLADDTYTVIAGDVRRVIALADPGIGDARNDLLWRPAHPVLIEATVQLRDATGKTLDTVQSYTALRSVGVQGGRFILNGRPHYLRLALDQGYWEDGGLTAPTDAAFRRDIELVKAMGFNGVRKHQKIEDPRFLYWADRMGLLVWEEMPSAYRFSRIAVSRVLREWQEAMERDRNHPCIVAWVPFNESWGVPDLPAVAAQRDYVRAAYHLTKTLDPSRPAIGNDGWESIATDIVGVHDYDDDAERIARRYAVPDFLTQAQPAARQLTLDIVPPHTPLMLTEFGGIALSPDEQGTWGYARDHDAGAFAARYTRLLETVHGLDVFAGFCYTQLTDTYQEANGLLTMHRTPKLPLETLAAATRGPLRRGEG